MPRVKSEPEKLDYSSGGLVHCMKKKKLHHTSDNGKFHEIRKYQRTRHHSPFWTRLSKGQRVPELLGTSTSQKPGWPQKICVHCLFIDGTDMDGVVNVGDQLRQHASRLGWRVDAATAFPS